MNWASGAPAACSSRRRSPTGGSRRTTPARTGSNARAKASRRRCPRFRTRTGQVLPHERTHAGPKEGRLRLLRATRTQLEPIFLLYDDEPLLERPAGEPSADVVGGGVRTRIWPVEAGELQLDDATPDRGRPPSLRDRRRLPAGASRGDTHLRDPRLVARARARDLPDPPARAAGGGRARASRSRRPTAA